MKSMLMVLLSVVGVSVLGVAAYLLVSHRSDADGFDFGHTERTLATGTPAKARILNIRDTGGRLNSNPSIELQLEVHPADGTTFVAMTRAIVSVVALPRYQAGAEIDVKYDPADRTSVAVVQ
jgi:hypothetical protein